MKDILNYSSIEDLYKAASKNSTFFPNNNFKNYLYYAHKRPDKRWIGAINPSCLLNMRLDEAINLNLTLIYADAIPNCLPINIKTPNYTDNWARRANYIEINNRALSSMVYDKSYESILNLIKFLPLIPPSTDKWANCVLISQLFPNIYGDGWNNNGENSIYGMIFDGG